MQWLSQSSDCFRRELFSCVSTSSAGSGQNAKSKLVFVSYLNGHKTKIQMRHRHRQWLPNSKHKKDRLPIRRKRSPVYIITLVDSIRTRSSLSLIGSVTGLIGCFVRGRIIVEAFPTARDGGVAFKELTLLENRIQPQLSTFPRENAQMVTLLGRKASSRRCFSDGTSFKTGSWRCQSLG